MNRKPGRCTNTAVTSQQEGAGVEQGERKTLAPAAQTPRGTHTVRNQGPSGVSGAQVLSISTGLPATPQTPPFVCNSRLWFLFPDHILLALLHHSSQVPPPRRGLP